jgi:hypothetical protein
MKCICLASARSGLKYAICALAILLFTVQLHCLINEEPVAGDLAILEEVENIKEGIFTEKQSDVTYSESITEAKGCNFKEETNNNFAAKVGTTIFKCAVAFLFGGMLSEMRFLKSGIF